MHRVRRSTIVRDAILGNLILAVVAGGVGGQVVQRGWGVVTLLVLLKALDELIRVDLERCSKRVNGKSSCAGKERVAFANVNGDLLT